MDELALPRLPSALALPAGSERAPSASATRRHSSPVRARPLIPRSAGANSPHRRATPASNRVFVLTAEARIDDSDAGAPFARTKTSPQQPQSSVSVVRPSSMRLVPKRGVKQLVGSDMEDLNYGSDHSREEQHQQTPLDGDDDELAQENHVLRQENARLQQRLVEKMRGNSKILVSGGQFRSSVQPQKQAPAVPASPVGVHSTCTSCLSLRTSLKQLRQDHMHVQERTREYAQQLQRLETIQQALEEAVDGRDRVIYALESEIETQSAQKGTLAAQIESLQRNVMHLEALNESLTREIADFKTAKTLVCAHKSVQCDVSESSESSREENLPFTDSDALTRVEKELLAVRSINQALIQETLSLQKTIHLLENDKSALHEEIRQWKTRSETMETQLSELESTRRAMESTMTAVTQSRDELRQENEVLQANHQRLQDAVSARDQQLSRLARRMNESESDSHRLRDMIEEEELQVVKMRKEVAEMATTLMDKTSDHATLTEELRCAIAVSKEQATSMQKLQDELCRVQGECQVVTRCLLDTQNELARVSLTRTEAEALMITLHDRIAAADAELAMQTDLLGQVKRSNATTLEKALQSAVRLCVVAPTVNVHLSGNNGSNSVVTCRSTLPQRQLQQVVERDVLPQFTSVFQQTEESAGAGDPWVQSLLRGMQESLATHLQELYVATTTNATASDGTSRSPGAM